MLQFNQIIINKVNLKIFININISLISILNYKKKLQYLILIKI